MSFHIWIVDDEIEIVKNDIFKCNNFIIDNELFEIHYCDNPSDFLKQLTYSEMNVDAVLLDVNFEKMNSNILTFNNSLSSFGLTLLKEIKSIEPILPVLMMTNISDSNIAFDAANNDADDFIDKSILSIDFNSTNVGILAGTELTSRIKKIWHKNISGSVYDLSHQFIVDKIALDYDELIHSRVATVAYYHYENSKIINEIKIKLKEAESVKILDLGCGTGRIEELLSNVEQFADKIEVVAVDFSGNMLKEVKKKINNKIINNIKIKIIKSPAETFAHYQKVYESYFDFIVIGFGLLSHINYKQIFPSLLVNNNIKCKNGAINIPHTDGLYTLLKDSGSLLVSAYNEKSIIYETISKKSFSNSDVSVLSVLNPYTGSVNVNGDDISCEGFSIDRLKTLLNQAGFIVNESDFSTFPTIHLSINNSEVESTEISLGFKNNNTIIHQDGYFSQELFLLDREFSNILYDKGHYIVCIAKKGSVST